MTTAPIPGRMLGLLNTMPGDGWIKNVEGTEMREKQVLITGQVSEYEDVYAYGGAH